jgi:hypothetical protein
MEYMVENLENSKNNDTQQEKPVDNQDANFGNDVYEHLKNRYRGGVKQIDLPIKDVE